MEEIKDQAALIGCISWQLPTFWAPDVAMKTPNICFMLPSGGLTHANGDIVVPKLDFIPDKETLTYAQVFERYGVSDTSVLLCQIIARKKVYTQIDLIFEIISPMRMPIALLSENEQIFRNPQVIPDKRTFSRIWLEENFFNHSPER